uniref:Fibronectin type-III domain-containing protein n=1 Tax=Heterorhabditis bacteriophora TaxID=37862 RepID=A0A1I7XIF9_HETBA
MDEHYSSQFLPRSYSNLNVDCLQGVIRPVPQRSPLTKQVNQLAYEIPKNKYAQNSWNYAPEFLKVCWLFNNEKIRFTDIIIEDTADVCRITIPYVLPHHFGTFSVLCENEVGRATASAELLPLENLGCLETNRQHLSRTTLVLAHSQQ